MTTLIDRATEALFLRARKEGGTDAATLDEAGPEMRRWLSGHVRLLLEVMRDNPTDAMAQAGYQAKSPALAACCDNQRELAHAAFDHVWVAAIDAALAAPEEGRD